MAFKEAVRLDLKALGLGGRGVDFRCGGEIERVLVEVSSFSNCINGCSDSQLSDWTICLVFRSEVGLDIEGDGRVLALSAELKSSGEASDTIDSVDNDRAVKIPASSPSLPTIIPPSTNSSIFPNSPSNCAFPRLLDIPLFPAFISS